MCIYCLADSAPLKLSYFWSFCLHFQLDGVISHSCKVIVYTYHQLLTALFKHFFNVSLYAFRCLLCIFFRSFTHIRFSAQHKEFFKHLSRFLVSSQHCSTLVLKITVKTLIKNYRLQILKLK